MKTVKGIEVEDKYRILSIEGYFQRVYEIMQEDDQPTMYEAYMRTEEELEQFGVQRYSTYSSFKQQKHLYFKSKQPQPQRQHNTPSLFD